MADLDAAGQPIVPAPAQAARNENNASFLRAARAGNLERVLEHLRNGTDINTCNSNGLNALHLASKEGHHEVVRELLRRGAIVDSATRKGNTALHIASLAGQDVIVAILVENGANPNAQSLNGFTPLYMAAQENHEQVVGYLLHHNANQLLATEDGFTPLAVALQQGHDRIVALLLENDNNSKVRLPALHIAAKKDDIKAASLLLQNEQNADVTSKSGFTPLHIAAHYGNENVARLLLEKGAQVNYQARHNISPLHVASKWGRTNLCNVLLSHGAIIDCRTRDLLTPLHCAARSGHDQVVDLLLEKGAPIAAKTKNGLVPLHMAAQGDHVECARILIFRRANVDDVTVDYLTPLHVAAHCGHVRVAKLLLDRSAEPNARALNGFTPLHIACKKNRIKVVELLLKYQAAIEATTESGLSPLHVASFMGCTNIVIYLIQQGANVDVETVRGETPLHLAARANQTDIVRVLVRNGAKVDAQARELQTPLHIAARLGNTDICMLLLQAGANSNAATKDLYTPLHIAAKEGQEEVAVILLDHKADKNLFTKKGFTPLHLACKYGNYGVAKLLLDQGTPVDIQGKNQVTPLHVAAHYNNDRVAQLLLENGASSQATAKNGYTPLHIAAKKNQMDIASFLLQYKADPNAESRAGFTPLHLASEEGHREMAALLMENGSHSNAPAKNGLTPMHLCAQEDRVEVAQELLRNGADVNAATKAGYTPLHVACHFGQMNMVRFLIENGANIEAVTNAQYTPLHQAAQQGHNNVCRYLLEHGASPNTRTSTGQTPLSIAQRLGYVSVVETLKTVTETTVVTETTTVTEERYKPHNPEGMNETMFSDSEEEPDDNQAHTAEHAKDFNESITQGLKDSATIHLIHTGEQGTSNPIDNVDMNLDEVIKRAQNQPVTTAMPDSSFLDNGHDDNVIITHDEVRPSFLISFLVDARGGAMRGCRHSGVRVIIPPRKAAAPMRITCRYLRKEKLAHPPPLSEGEALASRVLEMGPHNAKFLGPVILEVPHFASLRGREREIVILRSDDGQHWKEHQLEATEDAVQEVLNESFDTTELQQLDDLHTSRITRILTNDFPMYFAVVTRIRQEVHCVGPEGGVILSSVVSRVQGIFPDGSLTKTIKVSLQSQHVPQEIVAKLHGNRVAVSPIVTVEPRRRKFHKPITLCIPLPQSTQSGMINRYQTNQPGSEPPTLRLLCSITGGSSPAQWEDITGTTQLTFTGEDVSFTTTVSARFWLMDTQTPRNAAAMAQEVYNEAIAVPYMAKFAVFARRPYPVEGQLRLFCMTDDKEDKTLEKQENFIEVAKSREVEVLSGRHQFLEFAGNILPVTKSGDQLSIYFLPFQENRLGFNVKVRQNDDEEAASAGRIAIMKEARVRAENIPPQHPICTLSLTLPDYSGPLPQVSSPLHQEAIGVKYAKALSQIPNDATEPIPIAFVARHVGADWPRLARALQVPDSDIRQIKREFSGGNEPINILKIWIYLKGTEATPAELQSALRRIGRDDIVHRLNKNDLDSEGDSLRFTDINNLRGSNFSSKVSVDRDFDKSEAQTSEINKTVTRTERYVHGSEQGPVVDERTVTTTYKDDEPVDKKVDERTTNLNDNEHQQWHGQNQLPIDDTLITNSRQAMITTQEEKTDNGYRTTTTFVTSHIVPDDEEREEEYPQHEVEEEGYTHHEPIQEEVEEREEYHAEPIAYEVEEENDVYVPPTHESPEPLHENVDTFEVKHEEATVEELSPPGHAANLQESYTEDEETTATTPLSEERPESSDTIHENPNEAEEQHYQRSPSPRGAESATPERQGSPESAKDAASPGAVPPGLHVPDAEIHPDAAVQKKEVHEEGYANADGSEVVAKKMTRVITTSQSAVSGVNEQPAYESREDSDTASVSNVSMGSVRDRIAIFESLKEKESETKTDERRESITLPAAVEAGIVGAAVATFDHMTTAVSKQEEDEHTHEDESLNAENSPLHEKIKTQNFKKGDMSEVYDERRTQPDTHEDIAMQTIESINLETKPEEKSYIQQISEKKEIYTIPQSISETFNQTYTEDQLQTDNASPVNHPNLETKVLQIPTEIDEVALNKESDIKATIKEQLTAENTPETELIEKEKAKAQNKEKDKQGDKMENEQSSSDCATTKFAGESSELQKSDEITEEPLQQRPVDIPYPEEKDEGPGLATKIAGAVAGVTVGGAILAYNKVKDAIGGNDEESEYPSEHETPEAHYFEEREQIMHESEFPPTYDEATKIQISEEEHADPYLIQAKHEGGFEQSDENLTREENASPERREGSSSYNYATKLETHKDENDDSYLIRAGNFFTETSNEDVTAERQGAEEGDALEITTSAYLFSKQSKSEQLQNVSTTDKNNYLNEKDVVPDRPQTPMEIGTHEVVEEAEVSSLSTESDQHSSNIKEHEKSIHEFKENIFIERNEPSESAEFQGISEINDKQVEKQQPSTQSAGDAEQARLYEQEQSSHGESTEDEVQTTTDTNIASQTEETVQKENLDRGEHVKQEFEAQQSYEQPTSQQQSEHADPYLLHTKSENQIEEYNSEQVALGYPETTFEEETEKLQKSGEIAEEPLQQRPVDIPYPEDRDKDEGPGLATKIAGAVAGVTVGGAILAYNKVKDAIGGNDEESEYPSEHETPEAHYFEEREQIMHESEFPPTYDEATKIQISEEEHADPYLIQAKHEGGFEQSDENLTKEGNASPEVEKVETYKEDNEEKIIKTPSEPFDQTEVDIKTTTEIVTQEIPGGYVETRRITVEENYPEGTSLNVDSEVWHSQMKKSPELNFSSVEGDGTKNATSSPFQPKEDHREGDIITPNELIIPANASAEHNTPGTPEAEFKEFLTEEESTNVEDMAQKTKIDSMEANFKQEPGSFIQGEDGTRISVPHIVNFDQQSTISVTGSDTFENLPSQVSFGPIQEQLTADTPNKETNEYYGHHTETKVYAVNMDQNETPSKTNSENEVIDGIQMQDKPFESTEQLKTENNTDFTTNEIPKTLENKQLVQSLEETSNSTQRHKETEHPEMQRLLDMQEKPLTQKPSNVPYPDSKVLSKNEESLSETEQQQNEKSIIVHKGQTEEAQNFETEISQEHARGANKPYNYEYPETTFVEETQKLQKSGEITEEPLQQRPVDIPYPEDRDKDEGPGLATKIAGAVAGVTVGGAILAYNKVKDAIGGNDEESEYPSEHETPEAHYFEEREQIMHESEFPPTYDEATKIQISEEEHADPYLIQAKHEGGFEQSDENLTKEGNASPEVEKVETYKEDNEEKIIKTPPEPFDQTEVDIKTTTEIVTQEIPGGYVETQRITVEEIVPANEHREFVHSESIDDHSEYEKRPSQKNEVTELEKFSHGASSEQFDDESSDLRKIADINDMPLQQSSQAMQYRKEWEEEGDSREYLVQGGTFEEQEALEDINVEIKQGKPATAERNEEEILRDSEDRWIEHQHQKSNEFKSLSEHTKDEDEKESPDVHKTDETTGEPLQQRPVDIPYPEDRDKDEGPGLATKIAGAVAGVTVGGAILAYNKVKDAIGGNDEESKYPTDYFIEQEIQPSGETKTRHAEGSEFITHDKGIPPPPYEDQKRYGMKETDDATEPADIHKKDVFPEELEQTHVDLVVQKQEEDETGLTETGSFVYFEGDNGNTATAGDTQKELPKHEERPIRPLHATEREVSENKTPDYSSYSAETPSPALYENDEEDKKVNKREEFENNVPTAVTNIRRISDADDGDDYIIYQDAQRTSARTPQTPEIRITETSFTTTEEEYPSLPFSAAEKEKDPVESQNNITDDILTKQQESLQENFISNQASESDDFVNVFAKDTSDEEMLHQEKYGYPSPSDFTTSNKQQQNDSYNYEYAETTFEKESKKLHKSGEITEEPLQQRPVDIPYPEDRDKDEGPGLATKIAGAVAGVTVGGAILAYNKVKDAIGGNDEESEYPSEHETPEAHYFEEREQIMHESEFPPTYDEATKIQISEEEHADPYLIQAKHEGGFEQSDENLTKEGNASPEVEKVETYKEDNEEKIIKTPPEPFDQTEVDIKTTTEIVTQEIPGGYVETQRITVEEILPANDQREFVHSESIDDHSEYKKITQQQQGILPKKIMPINDKNRKTDVTKSDELEEESVVQSMMDVSEDAGEFFAQQHSDDDTFSINNRTTKEIKSENIDTEFVNTNIPIIDKELSPKSMKSKYQLQDQTDSQNLASEYPETKFAGEAYELQKSDEITEEPLQQRPVDIPYPEDRDKDEGPGLATKIAGAVAGVTVGGAILAYNKVKDAIGGNDEESEYPSEHETPEAHYFEEREQIMHESEFPPTYDEATKIQISEEEHADPYLIQAKHEGGFEQSDENVLSKIDNSEHISGREDVNNERRSDENLLHFEKSIEIESLSTKSLRSEPYATDEVEERTNEVVSSPEEVEAPLIEIEREQHAQREDFVSEMQKNETKISPLPFEYDENLHSAEESHHIAQEVAGAVAGAAFSGAYLAYESAKVNNAPSNYDTRSRSSMEETWSSREEEDTIGKEYQHRETFEDVQTKNDYKEDDKETLIFESSPDLTETAEDVSTVDKNEQMQTKEENDDVSKTDKKPRSSSIETKVSEQPTLKTTGRVTNEDTNELQLIHQEQDQLNVAERRHQIDTEHQHETFNTQNAEMQHFTDSHEHDNVSKEKFQKALEAPASDYPTIKFAGEASELQKSGEITEEPLQQRPVDIPYPEDRDKDEGPGLATKIAGAVAGATVGGAILAYNKVKDAIGGNDEESEYPSERETPEAHYFEEREQIMHESESPPTYDEATKVETHGEQNKDGIIKTQIEESVETQGINEKTILLADEQHELVQSESVDESHPYLNQSHPGEKNAEADKYVGEVDAGHLNEMQRNSETVEEPLLQQSQGVLFSAEHQISQHEEKDKLKAERVPAQEPLHPEDVKFEDIAPSKSISEEIRKSPMTEMGYSDTFVPEYPTNAYEENLLLVKTPEDLIVDINEEERDNARQREISVEQEVIPASDDDLFNIEEPQSYLSEDEDIYLQNEKRLANEGNIATEDFELVQSEDVAEEQNIATNFDEEEITPSRKSSKAENVADDVILKHQDSSSTMTDGSQNSPEGSEAERLSQSTVIRAPSFLPGAFEEEDYAAQKSDDEELVTSETPLTATHPLIFEDKCSSINRFDDQEVISEIKEKKTPEENILSEYAELHRTTEEDSKATTGIKDIVDSESVSGDHFESPIIPEQKDISEEAVLRKLESVSGYPETKFAGEASELQKGDEITEEPLQQRPVDIPYPEDRDKDEGPGLATKIAGAVAGVTVGGAILAYNKVKDAIGGNDEESEYPSEHETPEAHYFEEREQIMHESEFPPTYDEATKIQISEEEHADPYLIQAKHEGGFEQNDENLTREGNASPEAEKVQPYKEDNEEKIIKTPPEPFDQTEVDIKTTTEIVTQEIPGGYVETQRITVDGILPRSTILQSNEDINDENAKEISEREVALELMTGEPMTESQIGDTPEDEKKTPENLVKDDFELVENDNILMGVGSGPQEEHQFFASAKELQRNEENENVNNEGLKPSEAEFELEPKKIDAMTQSFHPDYYGHQEGEGPDSFEVIETQELEDINNELVQHHLPSVLAEPGENDEWQKVAEPQLHDLKKLLKTEDLSEEPLENTPLDTPYPGDGILKKTDMPLGEHDGDEGSVDHHLENVDMVSSHTFKQIETTEIQNDVETKEALPIYSSASPPSGKIEKHAEELVRDVMEQIESENLMEMSLDSLNLHEDEKSNFPKISEYDRDTEFEDFEMEDSLNRDEQDTSNEKLLGVQHEIPAFRPLSPVPPSLAKHEDAEELQVADEQMEVDSLNGDSRSSGEASVVDASKKKKHTSYDNVSESSLQEFERLEYELQERVGDSPTSENAEYEKVVESQTGSISSLIEFENIEREVRESAMAAAATAEEVMMLSDIREESEIEEMSVREDDEDEEDSLSETKPPQIGHDERQSHYPVETMLTSTDSLEAVNRQPILLETSTDSLEPRQIYSYSPNQNEHDEYTSHQTDQDSLLEGVSQSNLSQETQMLSGDTVATYQEYQDDDDDDDKDSLTDVISSYPTTLTTFETVQRKDDGSVETISRRVMTRVTDPVHSRVKFTGTEDENRLHNIPVDHPVETVDEEGNVTTTQCRRTPTN